MTNLKYQEIVIFDSPYIPSCASEPHLKFKTLQKEPISDLNYFSFNIY